MFFLSFALSGFKIGEYAVGALTTPTRRAASGNVTSLMCLLKYL